MTGVSDYLLKIVVADLHAYEIFVRKVLHPIGSIASIDTSFAYGPIKKTGIFRRIYSVSYTTPRSHHTKA